MSTMAYRWLNAAGHYGTAYVIRNRTEFAKALETETARAVTLEEIVHAEDQVSYAVGTGVIRGEDAQRLLDGLRARKLKR